MEKKKGKILIMSDNPLLSTGYATISRSIANGMIERGWDVEYMGHGMALQPLVPPIKFEDNYALNFKLYGSAMRPYCQDIITPMIYEKKPDIFFILLDTFMMMENPPNWFLNVDLGAAKSMFYFPSDGGGALPKNPGIDCANVLRKVNCAISMSRYGQRQVKKTHGLDVKYIPHAVDIKAYYPMTKDERFKLRQEWSPRLGMDLTDKFIVGTVARNQGRKLMDRTIKAFALFAREHKDALLLLHTDPDDLAKISDLRILIQQYDIENRCLFTGMKYYKGFDYFEMNQVYNLMDIFLLSTSGEGFGIPTIEAMACGVPPVVTDYTTTHELLIEDGQCGEPVKLVGTEKVPLVHTNEIMDGTLTGNWSVERGIMSVYDCKDKLNKLYKDASLREHYGKIGKKKVDIYYNWNSILDKWNDLFEEMLNG